MTEPTDEATPGNSSTYTVAMCNLNNASVIEESIRSIADQLDSRFEILIVDDGSTDGSLGILQRLEAELPLLRVVLGDNDNLGEARNQSFHEATGTFILESMDPDDRYDSGILDFVEIFEQLNGSIEGNFYLKGKSINIASRELLLEYPYRSMDYGEDRDLWKRLFADNRLIWLEHESFCEMLRDENTLRTKIRNEFEKVNVDFRSGVSFPSFVRFCLTEATNDTKLNLFRLSVCPLAYGLALRRGRFPPPSPEFSRMGGLRETIREQSMTLREVESNFGVRIDRESLSQRGNRSFSTLIETKLWSWIGLKAHLFSHSHDDSDLGTEFYRRIRSLGSWSHRPPRRGYRG